MNFLTIKGDLGDIVAKVDYRGFVQVSVVLSLIIILITQYFQRAKTIVYHKGKSGWKVIPAYYFVNTLRMPVLRMFGGFITLYNLRKYGVKFLEWAEQRWGTLFEIPLGFTTVVTVSDAHIAQKVLSSTDLRHLNKPRGIYDALFVDFLRDGLVSSETEIWAPHRKMMASSFTYKALTSYLQFMNKHSRSMTEDLLKSAKSPEKTDVDYRDSVGGDELHKKVYFHAMKIISEIAMGTEAASDEDTANFHKTVSSFKKLLLHRFQNPILLLKPVWWLYPLKKKYEAHVEQINGFMTTVITNYRQQISKSKATDAKHQTKNGETSNDSDSCVENDRMYKEYHSLVEEMLGNNATDNEILDEVVSVIFAGHESVAAALKMLMFNLALNPDHQKACQDEIDGIFKAKLPQNKNLTMDDLSDLKYLERCILESARLTSTVPMFLRRLDAPLQIDEGLSLDKDTNIAVNVWCLHKNPEYYPNPEEFQPDRFLPEIVKNRPPFSFIPFSGGPRNCIGWKVAIMEIKVIMAWLLRHFEISTSDGPQDVDLLIGNTLLPKRQHNITLTRRTKA